MLDGEPKSDAPAERVAHDVDLLVAEPVEDHGHVVAHFDQVDLPVAECGASVAVQVDADDLAVLGEDRQHGTEHVDRAQPAVQQQERLALSVDLVVVVDAVGLDAAACLRLRLRRGCHRPSWVASAE
jgi:hypothetical protein